jgi:hypothetical protein
MLPMLSHRMSDALPLETASATTSTANLHLDETIRRNLRKTPDERVETLLAALREAEARGWWPKTDRKSKEQRLLVRSAKNPPGAERL